jgi:hypothetical protein
MVQNKRFNNTCSFAAEYLLTNIDVIQLWTAKIKSEL